MQRITTIKQCSSKKKKTKTKTHALYASGQVHKWALFHFYDRFNITLSITNQTLLIAQHSEKAALLEVLRGSRLGVHIRGRGGGGTEGGLSPGRQEADSSPKMPECGHTLERDVTANLLSAILSLCFFHFKLGGQIQFQQRKTAASRAC